MPHNTTASNFLAYVLSQLLYIASGAILGPNLSWHVHQKGLLQNGLALKWACSKMDLLQNGLILK